MRRALFVTLAVVAGCFGMLATARPAAACSCAGEPELAVEFRGVVIAPPASARFAKLFRFRAESGRNVEAGQVIEVLIDGTDPPKDGVQHMSTCSVGPNPTAGGTYNVGATQGTDEHGTPRYYASLCGGYVTDASAAAAQPGPDPPPKGSAEGTFLAGGFGSIALVLVGGFTVRAFVRGSARAST